VRCVDGQRRRERYDVISKWLAELTTRNRELITEKKYTEKPVSAGNTVRDYV